jgi:hypothetical protein
MQPHAVVLKNKRLSWATGDAGRFVALTTGNGAAAFDKMNARPKLPTMGWPFAIAVR